MGPLGARDRGAERRNGEETRAPARGTFDMMLSTGFEPAIFPLRRGRLTTWPRKLAFFLPHSYAVEMP